MDPLALLCTLHADGPATLQRLRARGHRSLGALLGHDADALSDDLGVPPAAARRFLREAKLLAARVGAEGLEPEEAPPGHEGRKAPISPPEERSIPAGPASDRRTDPTTAGSGVAGSGQLEAPDGRVSDVGGDVGGLDERDRTLVEQILATGASDSAASSALAAASPLADSGAGLDERLQGKDADGVDGTVESLPASAPAPEPAAVPAVEPIAESGPADPASASFEEGSLFPGCIPGLEEDLVADLKAMGVTTLEDLAKAQSLQLTRALGITFAQARRLGFLARREAGRLDRPAGRSDGRPTDRSVGRSVGASALTSPLAPLDPRPEPVHTEPEVQLPANELRPEAPAPLASAGDAAVEPAHGTASDMPAGPSVGAAESERRPFWEPRTFLAESQSSSEEPASAQGVKVDPAEIAPRPRFGDRLARAAAERAEARSRDAAQAEGRGAAAPLGDGSGGTVLGWNFEIPRPVEEPALPLGSVAVPEEPSVRAAASRSSSGHRPAEADNTDDETAGPFA